MTFIGRITRFSGTGALAVQAEVVDGAIVAVVTQATGFPMLTSAFGKAEIRRAHVVIITINGWSRLTLTFVAKVIVCALISVAAVTLHVFTDAAL